MLSAGIEPAEYGSIDSTGLSRNNASEHYIKRIDRDKPIKRPLKLSMYVSKRRIFSFRLRAKWRGDTKDFPYLLNNAALLAEINCLDKGYDANWVHEEFRDRGVYSIIPVRKNCRRGRYRKEMRDFFDLSQYWERNSSEYNNSSLKRRFGDFVRSVVFRAQHSEVAARIILHNLKAILLGLFQGSPLGKPSCVCAVNFNYMLYTSKICPCGTKICARQNLPATKFCLAELFIKPWNSPHCRGE